MTGTQCLQQPIVSSHITAHKKYEKNDVPHAMWETFIPDERQHAAEKPLDFLAATSPTNSFTEKLIRDEEVEELLTAYSMIRVL